MNDSLIYGSFKEKYYDELWKYKNNWFVFMRVILAWMIRYQTKHSIESGTIGS